ncbi:MAG TPA: PAS domain S-box protein [Oligoflexus sp.]|uniref:PAS domain S-box protein n=1 Tax=Oligoflexus sp. TaxID=1971216 RepID=UPI002D461423|nr:PAS domain S-box protein [Oligoflexus sp.]HYX31626.1 PAS domain S-box protein [Oligoflexus sp.]
MWVVLVLSTLLYQQAKPFQRRLLPVMFILAITVLTTGLLHFMFAGTSRSLFPPSLAWLNVLAAFGSVGAGVYLYRLCSPLLSTMQARQALADREQALWSFFDSAPMMMGISDVEGDNIRHVSDNLAAAEFFGQSDADLQGKLASELGVPREGIDLWVGHYREAEASRRPVQFEYTHQGPSALRRLSAVVSYIGRNPQGYPRFSYLVQDITDIRRTEAALVDAKRHLESRIEERTAELLMSQQKFARTFEIAPFAFALVKMPEGIIVDVNSAWVQLLGYSREEALGKSGLQLGLYKNADDRDRLYEEFHRAGEVRNFETTLITKEGRTRVASSNMKFIDIAGERHILGTLVDITDRKQAQQNIEAQKERLRMFIKYTPLDVAMFDRNMNYLEVSVQWLRTFGFQASSILGKNHYEIFPNLNPDWIAIHQRALQGSIEVGETSYVDRNGQFHFFRYDIRPWRDEENELGGIIIFNEDITEQRRAREELNESKAKLEAAFQAVSDGIMVFDTAGQVVLLNEAEARICGFESIDDMKRDLPYFVSVFQLSSLDDTPLPIEQWPVSRVMRGESLPYLELRGRRVDTGQAWIFSYTGEPVFDDQGRQTLSVIVTRDITRGKQAEEQLRESEERFRTVTNNAASCLFMMDRNGRPTFMNPAAMRVTGYGSLEEIKGKPLHDAVHWKKADGSPYPMEECPIDNAQADLQTVQNQAEVFCRKDGSLFPVSYSIAPLEKNGEVIGSVLEFRDVTEEKKSELALRESETRYRILADAVPYLVLTHTREGQLTYFNHQWTLYTGQPVEWLLQKVFETVHPDDLDRLVMARTQALALGRPNVSELRLRDAKGLYNWHSLNTVPLLNDRGEILAWYAAAVNIEDQKRAQDILRTAKRELEEEVKKRTEELRLANQELESFSYTVSHDLRAPLRSINGFSKRLMRRLTGLDPAALEDLERIRAASVRMGCLIDDLLRLAKVSRTKPDFKAVDLSQLAHNVVEELREGDSDRDNVEIHITPGLVTFGDANLLRQVLQNLIGNSWKFTRGLPKAWIKVDGSTSDSTSLVTVEDNGAGFNMEYAGQLFAPFQRLHDEDEFEGTGIGLATVQRILHKHGGRIWAEAEPGKGAKFSFTLPSVQGKEHEIESENPTVGRG